MPHSPYTKTIEAPITDLESYRTNNNWQRGENERNPDYFRKWDLNEFFDDIDALIEQCDFLEVKLDIKKRKYAQLGKQYEDLKTKSQAQESKSQAQESKIAKLEEEIEKLKATANSHGNLDHVLDANGVRKVEEDSPNTAGTAKSRKRSASPDQGEGNASKKGKTDG